MKYDALTFDTQTVLTNGFHFDGGLLGRLKQFRDGPTAVVVSEVVKSEIIKHLTENTQKAKDALISAHKKAVLYGLADEKLSPLLFDEDSREISRSRLTNFMDEIGCDIILASNVSVEELLSLYFVPAPPFSPTGAKKNEFPDAIALLSLEAWATENDKKLLAVSGDADWANYAKRSDNIDVVSDLAAALSLLQQHREDAEKIVIAFLSQLREDPSGANAIEIDNRLADEITSQTYTAEADSFYYLDVNQIDVTYVENNLLGKPEKEVFTVLQAGPKRVSFKTDFEVSVTAEADFSFSVYDSIDKEHVGMGNAGTLIDTTLVASAIITISEADGEFFIEEIELVEADNTIDFGSVEPDYGEDYYDEDDDRESFREDLAEPALGQDDPF